MHIYSAYYTSILLYYTILAPRCYKTNISNIRQGVKQLALTHGVAGVAYYSKKLGIIEFILQHFKPKLP
jgi:hypothetical protein